MGEGPSMLSQSDREWVRAIVQAAISEATTVLLEETDRKIEKHVSACPNAIKHKAVMIGILIGVTMFAADGTISLIKTMLAIINGV